jgi:hypothetical protein
MEILRDNNAHGVRLRALPTPYVALCEPWNMRSAYGFDEAGTLNYLNDLWKFDGTNWTWVKGSNVTAQSGDYGVKGVPAPSNMPGVRTESVSWIDANGHPWIFGGYGRDGSGAWGYFERYVEFRL